MKIVIATASELECHLIKSRVSELYTSRSTRFKVSFHKTGIGILPTTFALQQLIIQQKPDLVIQAGIAGTFSKELQLSQVVTVQSEYLGDVGVQEEEHFKDVYDLQLEQENDFPYKQKALENPWLEQFNLEQLKAVPAVTVNEISTRTDRIDQVIKKYGAAIESMEGAALHYTGLMTDTPFIQIRAISNYVGDRDKNNWRIDDALDNLNAIVQQYLDKLYQVI